MLRLAPELITRQVTLRGGALLNSTAMKLDLLNQTQVAELLGVVAMAR